ncbi:hypothetical protein QBC37DRAFT_460631 [Rhypophila decipiens]|uniref:Uncharacterized protein n=1 Tax=Rhypophila decipiens TaxID=261697 RepID=A0AAN7B2T3_9PEZI|nr:hypothetical protein QBC37DRAFT_460631 [Rhypophila decipiens]
MNQFPNKFQNMDNQFLPNPPPYPTLEDGGEPNDALPPAYDYERPPTYWETHEPADVRTWETQKIYQPRDNTPLRWYATGEREEQPRRRAPVQPRNGELQDNESRPVPALPRERRLLVHDIYQNIEVEDNPEPRNNIPWRANEDIQRSIDAVERQIRQTKNRDLEELWASRGTTQYENPGTVRRREERKRKEEEEQQRKEQRRQEREELAERVKGSFELWCLGRLCGSGGQQA